MHLGEGVFAPDVRRIGWPGLRLLDSFVQVFRVFVCPVSSSPREAFVNKGVL